MYIYIINSIALLTLHLLFHKYRNSKFENFIWMFVIFLLSIFIGFRNEIGGDWIIYQNFITQFLIFLLLKYLIQVQFMFI